MAQPTNMQAHDWSQFTLRIPIIADPQTIFSYLTSQHHLEKWFLRKAEFKNPDRSTRDRKDKIQVNDTYEWMWYGWPDDVVERGTILELRDLHLKFSFGKAGNVTVAVKEEQGENILEVVQDEIPADEHSQVYFHIGCTKGWLFYMANLKSISEGGPDMRNRNEELKDVINS